MDAREAPSLRLTLSIRPFEILTAPAPPISRPSKMRCAAMVREQEDPAWFIDIHPRMAVTVS
jgi:hypothetical protein